MATVTDFSEAELWYIYEALTTQTFAGATQAEIWEIFNGTNPQGKAVSLFENVTVNKTSIADILYYSNGYLTVIDNNVGDIKNLIDTKTATATNQTTGNNSLSSIDTKLTNVATTTLQTTGNNSLSSIDTKLTNVATTTLQTTGNNSLSSIDTKLTTETTNTTAISNHTGSIRTPVLTSITGSLTISVQVHNLSVYNSGASAGTINVDGGGAISIPAGVTVNFDAGGNNNRYAINKFVLNATGTTFIVSYTQ